LLDNGKNDTSITVPAGISIFPNNGIYMFFGFITLFMFGIGFCLIFLFYW
jgi:hypothetical protein